MPHDQLDQHVSAIRRFSRFYTHRIGLLHEGLLGGPLSLAEGRLVYELAQRGTSNAKDLGAELGLDSGYLSRLLRGLEGQGLISKAPSATDGRQVVVSLTAAGRTAFDGLDARSRQEVGAMLDRLSRADQRQLAAALLDAERLLGGARSEAGRAVVLRPPRPGDMGWIVHRQAVLYAREYGFDSTYEALVAEIVAKFIREFDPGREQCWVAERDGAVVGSVFLVKASDDLAKLRLLYVEPSARGLGLGRQLVGETIRSAQGFGYKRLTLWTNDILVAARRIYQAAGFRLIAEEPHHSFGQDLVGQHWELDL